MKLLGVIFVAMVTLMLMTDQSDAWIFGSGCGRKCRATGSSGGRRYTSSSTGVEYCLCNGPTRFLPRNRKRRDLSDAEVEMGQ